MEISNNFGCFYFAKTSANITETIMHLLMRGFVQVHDQLFSRTILPPPKPLPLPSKVNCPRLRRSKMAMDPHRPFICSTTQTFHALLNGLSTTPNCGYLDVVWLPLSYIFSRTHDLSPLLTFSMNWQCSC